MLQVNDFAKKGYSVILFEGPGQGECIKQGIYFTDAFHMATSKVIDFFDLKTCAFVGISWGGYFALESAANEPRINKVVAYDVLDDGLEVMTNVYPSPIKGIIRALIKGKYAKAVNFLCSRIGKKSVIADWMLTQGMYITGSPTPYKMYLKLNKHNLKDKLQNIKQDVLLLAGEKDHYVPKDITASVKKLLAEDPALAVVSENAQLYYKTHLRSAGQSGEGWFSIAGPVTISVIASDADWTIEAEQQPERPEAKGRRP